MERKQLTEKQKQIRAIKRQINELKYNLSATDYQAIKYAEGEMSLYDFAPIKEQRRAWRVEINELEAQLVSLKNRGNDLSK